MTKMMLRYQLGFLVLIILAGPTLLLLALPAQQRQMPAQPPSPPKRLRLTVAKTTLNEGDRTDIVIDFLDRYYKPVPNDKYREIKLRLELSGTYGGYGDMLPNPLRAGVGATYVKAEFRAKRAGALKVKAVIEDLEEAQSLIYITRPKPRSSFISRLFDFTAYADDRMIFMEPIDQEPFLANNFSPVSFDLALFGNIEEGEKVAVEFKTDPLCAMKCDDPEAIRENGYVRLAFGKDDHVKRVSFISPAHPGPVKVSAQILPTQGSPRTATLDFKPPSPKSIFFADMDNKEINEKRMFSNDQIEPLKIMLADERKVPIGQLNQEWRVRLSSTVSDNTAIAFDPDTVTLSSACVSRQANLIVKKIPPTGYFNLLAQDDSRQLEAVKLKVLLVYPIQGVSIFGTKEVNPYKQYTLRVQLTDETKTPQLSDTDRTVQVTAEHGQLMSATGGEWASAATVTFARGDPFAEIKYQAPRSVGTDTISIQSNLPNNSQLEIKVVITTALLLLFGGFGGMLGGTLRHVYKDRGTHILPAKVKGQLEVGLLGNALLSVIIGVFFFLVANVGLVKISPFQPTQAWAFILGILGGVGGFSVLQKVLGLIFPEKPEEKAMAATAHPGN